MDLGDVGLRLMPNTSGGYDVSKTAYGFRQSLGSRIPLGDDDMREVVLSFVFPFFGNGYDRVFVKARWQYHLRRRRYGQHGAIGVATPHGCAAGSSVLCRPRPVDERNRLDLR